MNKPISAFVVTAALSLALPLQASVKIVMHAVDEKGIGKSVGEVRVESTAYGLLFTPALTGLTPGLHGFHLHENPSCEAKPKDGKMVAAQGAGGHYDPESSKKHGTPWGDGHRGDLPPLYVNDAGQAGQPVLAPRLRLEDLKGRSLMIHAGADNHADHPAPLGGGGARVACGVIR